MSTTAQGVGRWAVHAELNFLLVACVVWRQGTVDAVLCLDKQIKDGNPKKLWNMIDVLKEGNMR